MTKHHPSRITSILGTYHLSTEQERYEGEVWYEHANAHALALSGAYPFGVITTAGVIAALSPRNKWERNLEDAESVISVFHNHGPYEAEHVTVATYSANLRKAITILKLAYPTVDDVANVLNGLKVTAFYRCILGSTEHVCIDGHAYSIWHGTRVATPGTPKLTPRLYAQIESDYKEAAQCLASDSLTAPQLQAITWLTHRRLHAGKRG